MIMEKNTSKVRLLAIALLEQWDIFYLRRNPLLQRIWVRHRRRAAEKKMSEWIAAHGTAAALVDAFRSQDPDHRLSMIADPAFVQSQRAKFSPLIEYLGKDLQGRSLLDIGPGFGELLDLAAETGAITAFVDIDPAFAALNALKGHKPFILDYLKTDALSGIGSTRFDYVVSRGALNADQLNRQEPGVVSWPRFLDSVEKVWSGKGAIIINPTFDRGEDPKHYYQCRDREKLIASGFSQEMLRRGYEMVAVEQFNDPAYHPVSFIKRG